jgi:hypothetical protein
MVGLIIGIIQLFMKIRKKVLRISLIAVFIILLLLSSPILYFGAVFGYKPEHIVEKYVNGFLRTYVYYYDYKNFIVVGNQKRIEEYYGKGGFDPIENQYGYDYNVESTTYYDENGNVESIIDNK